MARCAVRLALLLLLLASPLLVGVLIDAETSSSVKKCPPNEVWSWCGKRCEPTCKVPVPTEKTCPEMVCDPSKSACRCEQEYVRNERNICVHLENCKKRN